VTERCALLAFPLCVMPAFLLLDDDCDVDYQVCMLARQQAGRFRDRQGERGGQTACEETDMGCNHRRNDGFVPGSIVGRQFRCVSQQLFPHAVESSLPRNAAFILFSAQLV